MWLAELSQTRGYEQILHSAALFLGRIPMMDDGNGLARLLQDAIDHVAYSVRSRNAGHSLGSSPGSGIEKQTSSESLAGLNRRRAPVWGEQTGRVHHAADREPWSLA